MRKFAEKGGKPNVVCKMPLYNYCSPFRFENRPYPDSHSIALFTKTLFTYLDRMLCWNHAVVKRECWQN